MKLDKSNCDFECWVIKYGTKVFDVIYKDNCLHNEDGMLVPLCWNHIHDDPDSVLGTAVLEKRTGGIYAYCTLNNEHVKSDVIKMLRDKGSVSLSPYVNRVKYDTHSEYGKTFIVDGVIREVSLVPARIDPDEAYYPVLNSELG
ncbi:MAG: hypothetical protein J6B01_04835 [Ruminococcus sp.]|nr:hypothetical protein [Ruminococcus sp.]MBO5319118.1 hypothetical protein [Ruminococcus sp.]